MEREDQEVRDTDWDYRRVGASRRQRRIERTSLWTDRYTDEGSGVDWDSESGGPIVGSYLGSGPVVDPPRDPECR